VGLRIADVLGPVALDSKKQLKDIFLTLGISDIFLSLPQGFDTFIAAGSSFSDADKVKLLLARSLLNPPPILLLDEFLSAIPSQDHAHLLALVTALPSTIVMTPTTKAEVECCSHQWQICEGTLTPLSQTTFADFLATYSR
jgi:ATP-binding cassette subfamily B protein